MLVQQKTIRSEIRAWLSDLRLTLSKLVRNTPDAFRILFHDAKGLCALYALVVIALSVAPYLLALTLGNLVDSLVAGGDQVRRYGWLLLLLMPIAPMAGRLQALASELLRTALWYKFLLEGALMLAKKPLSDHRDPEQQQKFSRIRERAQWRMNAYADNSFLFVLNSLGLLILAAMLFGQWGWLVLLCVATIPEYFVELSAARAERHLELALSEDERSMWHRRWSIVTPRCIEELQLLDNVERYHGKLVMVSARMEAMQCRLHKRFALFRLGVTVLSYSALGVAALSLLNQAVAGSLRPGELTFLVGGFVGFSGALSRLAVNLRDLCKDAYHVDEFLEVLHGNEAAAAADERIERPELSRCPRIVVEDVHYAHRGEDKHKAPKTVLKGMSCVIEPGMRVAVVGPSGGGKTTFINLLAGLHEPSLGALFVDGLRRDLLPRALWQQRVTVLLQAYNHFESLTLGELVEFGASRDLGSMVEADVWTALDRASAKGVVEERPGKLGQIYGDNFEGGTGLSGGEYQRIRIAGVLASDRGIWLLDEPTSQQDPIRHEAIMRELLAPRDGTTVFVTHQLAKCKLADLVLVIENGIVTQRGTHDELVAADGWYRTSYSAQAEQYGK